MKRYFVLLIVTIFYGVFNLSHLYAEEATAFSLNLNLLIEEALKNNKEIEAAREAYAAIRHRIPQASALPDPTVGYMVMGEMLETRLGPQEEVYEFEQMIPFPGKLYERRQMAKAEAGAAEAKLKGVTREVIYRVSEVYYDCYLTERTLETLQNMVDLLKRFEGIAQSRYASRQGGQADVAKAQSEISETLKQIFILRQQKETLTAMLYALLNRRSPLLFSRTPDLTLPKFDLSLEEMLTQAKKNRPEFLEATAIRNRDVHASNLAKYAYAPDLSLGFQYIRIGDGTTTTPDDGRDAWMIPLKVTIPLWQNRIFPSVLEAGRNLKSSEAMLKQIENLTEYELKNAYYRFMSAKQIVELYENALLPQTELAFRSDQAGYEAGRTDVLKLLDSERVFLNAKIDYYQAVADALKSVALMERVIGMDLR